MGLVLLTEVGDPNAAALLAARLRSEGIEATVTGEAEGPYRVTVGAMAVTEVWVERDDLEDARLVVLDWELAE